MTDRLSDPAGYSWLRAALRTVNAPLPVETTPEEMVEIILSGRTDMYAAVRIAAFVEEVPGRTIANIVSHHVFSYQELDAAMKRIHSVGLEVIDTETGSWISEMASFEKISRVSGLSPDM